ncbi:MAG: hypothetical protein QGG71_18340, partial [Pirellulaceae bacterium]|nr:hypothetical protein [Pirellulaceae bacterium]
PMIMAFGQTRPIAYDSWGDAPGYGDRWPLANASLQLQSSQASEYSKARPDHTSRAELNA